MKAFFLEPTEDSPRLAFDVEKGVIEISGRAFMADTQHYYNIVIDWLRSYIQNPRPSTHVIFNLEYTSAAVEQMICAVTAELDKYFIMGHSISIEWQVEEENEMMIEFVEELQQLFEIPISIRILVLK